MAIVKIHNLSISFRRGYLETTVLDDLTLSVETSRVVGILGESGCGKSTLLRILSGVEKNYTGEVLVYGIPPNPFKHSFALVPQHFALLPWKTIKENILLPLTFGKKKSTCHSFDEIVSTLKIEKLLHRYPSEISGGQQQRVALARAFLQKADLLLLDEPFSALDINNAKICKEFLMKQFKEESTPMTFLVSHNIEEIVDLCEEIVILKGIPGKIDCVISQPFTTASLKKILQE